MIIQLYKKIKKLAETKMVELLLSKLIIELKYKIKIAKMQPNLT